MQVNLPAINLDLPRQLPASVRGWMLGQVLDAMVIGRDSRNSIRLNVAGADVRAATDLPLRPGDKLSVRVTRLRPVVTLTPTASQPAPERQLVHRSVIRTMPAQRALAPSLDRLADAATASPGAAARPAIPVPAVQALSRLLASVPQLADIVDPERLPALVRRAGVFAESSLAKLVTDKHGPAPATQGDLKLQLLRLRADLAPVAKDKPAVGASPTGTSGAAPPAPNTNVLPSPLSGSGLRPASILPAAADAPDEAEPARRLIRLVDGAIAKIETNQLRTVAARLDGDLQFHLDLPVLFEDGHRDLRMQIFQEESGETSPGSESNTIVLEIPLDGDASLRAVVNLTADDLAVRLWSDDADVRATLARRREDLADRLRANGLDRVSVSLSELRPFDQWGRTFSRLVDTTA